MSPQSPSPSFIQSYARYERWQGERGALCSAPRSGLQSEREGGGRCSLDCVLHVIVTACHLFARCHLNRAQTHQCMRVRALEFCRADGSADTRHPAHTFPASLADGRREARKEGRIWWGGKKSRKRKMNTKKCVAQSYVQMCLKQEEKKILHGLADLYRLQKGFATYLPQETVVCRSY